MTKAEEAKERVRRKANFILAHRLWAKLPSYKVTEYMSAIILEKWVKGQLIDTIMVSHQVAYILLTHRKSNG